MGRATCIGRSKTVKNPGRLHVSVSLPSWQDQPNKPPSWSQMRDLAQWAEAAGVDAIFVADHSGFDSPDGPRTELWDGWTLLPALAEVTRTVAIGPLVATPYLRHPVVLARMAATLDEVSGGRLILGLGSSDPVERAFRVLGIPTDRLYSRFQEAVQIIVPLLRNGAIDFQGQFYEAHEAILGPTGPQEQAIPVWIGAKGPKMMRLAARWADAVNFQPPLSSLGGVRTLIGLFEDACRQVGRDPSTVEKTGWADIRFTGHPARVNDDWSIPIVGDPVQIAAQLHAFHQAGISHVSCYIDAGDEPKTRTLPLITVHGLELFAHVIAALRGLEAEGTGA